MIICDKCGAQNNDGSQVCSHCNQPITAAQQGYARPQPYGQQGHGQPPSPYGNPYQPNVQQGGYPPPPSPYGQPYQQNYYYPQKHPGESAATGALVCGIIGLFFLGLVLGIIAIVQGRKAVRLGYPGGKATAGIVLGVISLIGWAIIMIAIASGAMLSFI